MDTKAKIIIWVLAAVALLAVTSALVAWYRAINTPVASKTEYVKVKEPQVVTKIKRVYLPGPTKVETVEKEVIVEKMKLPEWVKTDADKQIIATAEIPAYEGTTNAAAVLDMKTGKSEIIAKQMPVPLFAFENVREIGARYGATIKNGMAADIYGRWDFARVGNLHLGAYGEVSTTGDGKAQISIGYRW